MKNKILLTVFTLLVAAFTSTAQLNYQVSKTTGNAFNANPSTTTTAIVGLGVATVNVVSTAGITKGMVVNVASGTDALSQGRLPLDCRVLAVTNATQFTITSTPVVAIVSGATLVFNQLLNKGRDDHGSCETVIGFPFNFGGTDYYTFSANIDGFIILGNPTFVTTVTTAPSSTATINAPGLGLTVGQYVVVQSTTGGLFSPQTRVTATAAGSFTVNIAPNTIIPTGATIRALNMQTAMGTQCQPSGATNGSPQGTLTGPWYCLAPGQCATTTTCNYTVSAVAPRACGNCDNNGGGLGAWYINNMTTTSYLPMIAPLWDDWVTNSTTGSVSYLVGGAAASRTLTIEFKNMARWPQYTATAYSFQVVLHQNSASPLNGGPDIEMNYKFEGTVNSLGASIGVKTTCAGDQYFLNQANAIDNSSNPSRFTETTTNAFPGDGVRFTWDAPLGAVTPTNDKLCVGAINNALPLVFGVGSCTPYSTTTKSATNSSLTAGEPAYANCGTQTQDQDIWFYVDVPLGASTTLTFPGNVGNTIINVTSPQGLNFNVGETIFVTSGVGAFPVGATVTARNASQITISAAITVGNAIPAGATIVSGSPMIVSTDLVQYVAGPCSAANGVQFQVFKSNQLAGGALGCPTLGACVLNSDNGGTLNTLNSTSPMTYVASGQRYYIRVDDDDAVTGNLSAPFPQYYDFQICVKDQFNDGICQAATLTPSTTCNPIVYSTVGATPSTSNAGNSCAAGLLSSDAGPPSWVQPHATPDGGVGSPNDVWFKFTVPNVAGGSQDWVIETLSGTLTDGAMGIYKRSSNCGALTTAANSGPDCSNPLSPIGPMGTYRGFSTAFSATNDNRTATELMPRIVATGLTLGATYYIRFWKGSTGIDGTFSICVYERPTCGVKVVSGCAAPAVTPGDANFIVWNTNPNGNFNGTKCSTPLPVFPLDTNGKCYNLYPKIPTVGSDFAPLCGDNYNTPFVARVGATGENPPDGMPIGPTFNQGFCGTAVPITAPLYYRIKAGATGSLKMDISNQLCGLNIGMRAGLYDVTPTPTSSTYDCSGITQWNGVLATVGAPNGTTYSSTKLI
ncbi:MAG: hypothetical protein IPP32_00330 [Bacteroidetes bacterium]|nr:hypothetical protein [Bacteroidota bacterium]